MRSIKAEIMPALLTVAPQFNTRCVFAEWLNHSERMNEWTNYSAQNLSFLMTPGFPIYFVNMGHNASQQSRQVRTQGRGAFGEGASVLGKTR